MTDEGPGRELPHAGQVRYPRWSMNGFVKRLAARLLDRDAEGAETLSRNRHFEVFSDWRGRTALRIYRHLRSLRADILAAPDAPIVERGPEGDQGRVRLEIRWARSVRTAYLSPDELEILLQNAAVRRRLTG